MKKVTVAPKGMGLNDFVAKEEGFFAAEGLDVTFDWKTFRGTQSSWKDMNYLERPQDQPYTKDKAEVIQGACVWGSICNATRRHGQVRRRSLRRFTLGDLRAAGLENPQARGPEGRPDLGRHARRQPLQRALPAGKIPAAREHQDREHRRLRRPAEGAARRRGRGGIAVAAADRDGRAAWPAQDHRGSLPYVVVGAGRLRADTTKGFLRALDRAEKAMDADLAKYLPLWKLAVPAEFENYHKWDFSKFGRGERFVYKTIPHSEFDEVMDQVKRWKLDDFLKDKTFEGLAAR